MTRRHIPVASPSIGPLEEAYVTDAIRSGWVSSIGPYLGRFEREFAAYVDCQCAIATCNGTTALHLILAALRIGPGDEVIVPSLTFVATAHAVMMAGATPVFADVEADTWCIDPAAVERAITPRTSAIIAVHLYGHPADMSALNAIADRHGLAMIEDAAEALGASVDGKPVGGLSTAAAFSFYGNKTITTGEGGMVTTNDTRLAERLCYLKDHGMHKTRRYFHTELSFNYRMTNLQAALGCAQLERINDLVSHRRRVFEWYHEQLHDVPEIVMNTERPGYCNAYWMPCVVLKEYARIDRENLLKLLEEDGIDTRPFFIPMHELPHLRRYVSRDAAGCPHSAYLGVNGFNLPTGGHIASDDCARISTTLRQLVSVGVPMPASDRGITSTVGGCY
jgi:perosamine synthetase